MPLADSCLALGAAACRRAIQLIAGAIAQGELGDPPAAPATAATAAAAPAAPATAAATAAAAAATAASASTGGGGASSNGAAGAAPAPGAEASAAETAPTAPHTRVGAPRSAAEGGRVIYAQTDSVFVHFPRASPLQAMRLGRQVCMCVRACVCVLLLEVCAKYVSYLNRTIYQNA